MDTKKRWYVLRAVSGKESKVKEYIESELKHNDYLAQRVGRVEIPTERQDVVQGGKRVVKERVSLPGYVLVEANIDGDVAHTLRFMPNVLGFLGGTENPSPIRESEYNRFMGIIEDKALQTTDDSTPYMVDETVKVIDGPFSGFSGVIEKVDAVKRKLKVTVKIFGRKTPLELGFMQVEKE